MEGDLFHDVHRNDAAAVHLALRNGADVNIVRGYATPLHEACKQGHDEIARMLLDAGADAWWRDSGGRSAIAKACQEEHLSIVEMLLDHDKDLLEIADNGGFTPLFVAISYQRVGLVRFLLDRGANVHAAARGGMTTLIRAIVKGNLAIVQMLLAAGVAVDARDEKQKTALIFAAVYSRIEIIRKLVLEYNANMFEVGRMGHTPFDLISRGTANATGFLYIYADKMTQDHGRLALHVILGAAEYAFVETEEFHPPLKPLIEIRLPLGKLTLNHFRSLLSTLDTNLIRNRDLTGKLPLHLACRNKAPVDVLSMLIEIDPATLHNADHAGALPLHECCRGVVDASSVRCLIEQGGVGTLAARTREGALPLHVLCGSTNASLRTVQYMVQSFPGSVTARTNAGQYPFMIAACESSTASLSVVYELVRANPDLFLPIFVINSATY